MAVAGARAIDRSIARSSRFSFAFLRSSFERARGCASSSDDGSIGREPNRTEPNRTEPSGRARRDAHAKARKTTAKPNPMKVATAFPNEPTSAPGTRRRRHPADSQSAAAVAGPPTHALLARRKSLRLSFDANRKGTRTEVR